MQLYEHMEIISYTNKILNLFRLEAIMTQRRLSSAAQSETFNCFI